MYGCAEICHSGQPAAGEHHKYEFIVFVKLVFFVFFIVFFFFEYAAACSSYTSSGRLTAASARAAT